jgi:ferrochelatase
VTKGRIAEARLLTESCESIAVVLFQLGGPDSLDAVEPFLSNIFSDPDIIDFPFARLARPSLARLISSRRARHVQQHYASLGGKSPIRELTARQAVALESELRKTAEVRVFVAMRYWHPLTEEVVERIIDGNFRDLVLLPLYPQYSKTTTGAASTSGTGSTPPAPANSALTRAISTRSWRGSTRGWRDSRTEGETVLPWRRARGL